VHIFDYTSEPTTMLKGSYIVSSLEDPHQILRIMEVTNQHQLVIFNSSVMTATIPKKPFLEALTTLLYRSFHSDRHQYSISVILHFQASYEIPPQLQHWMSFVDVARCNGANHVTPFAGSIPLAQIRQAKTELRGYARMHINNVQNNIIVHDPNKLHIRSKM